MATSSEIALLFFINPVRARIIFLAEQPFVRWFHINYIILINFAKFNHDTRRKHISINF